MQQNRVRTGFWLAASLLTVTLVAEVILQAMPAATRADQAISNTRQFAGQVLSASGALVVGDDGRQSRPSRCWRQSPSRPSDGDRRHDAHDS